MCMILFIYYVSVHIIMRPKILYESVIVSIYNEIDDINLRLLRRPLLVSVFLPLLGPIL